MTLHWLSPLNPPPLGGGGRGAYFTHLLVGFPLSFFLSTCYNFSLFHLWLFHLLEDYFLFKKQVCFVCGVGFFHGSSFISCNRVFLMDFCFSLVDFLIFYIVFLFSSVCSLYFDSSMSPFTHRLCQNLKVQISH